MSFSTWRRDLPSHRGCRHCSDDCEICASAGAAADVDGDGSVTTDELFRCVLPRARSLEDPITPQMWSWNLPEPIPLVRIRQRVFLSYRRANAMVISPSAANLFPPSALGRPEDSFDALHVADGVFQRLRRRPALEHRAREQVSLDGVLIAHRHGQDLLSASE